MVSACAGISMATTLSREPAPWGVARFKNDAIATTTSTPAMAMSTIFAGGRLRLAVPNSSAMLMVGPDGTSGAAALGAGGGPVEAPGISSGIDRPRSAYSTPRDKGPTPAMQGKG